MAMRPQDLQRLVHDIMVELGPSASEEGVQAIAFDVLAEFLDSSNAWFEWIQVPIQPGVVSYSVYPRFGGMINRMIASYDQNFVVVGGQITFGAPGGDPAIGGQTGFTSPPGAVYSLVYPQIQAVTYQLLVAKNVFFNGPTPDTIPEAPDWILPKWSRYIKAGILGQMMLTPKKPYTNFDLGKYHVQEFKVGWAMAGVEAERSYLRGGQSWRYPGGWHGRTQRSGVSTGYPWIGANN